MFSAEMAEQQYTLIIFLECILESGNIRVISIIASSRAPFCVSSIYTGTYLNYKLLKVENRVGILFRSVVEVAPNYDAIEAIYCDKTTALFVARRGVKYHAFKQKDVRLKKLNMFLSTWDSIRKRVSMHATVDDETFSRVHSLLGKGESGPG
jgi:hypothetical protein